jgi:ATP-dependent helicase/nuclease subunit A
METAALKKGDIKPDAFRAGQEEIAGRLAESRNRSYEVETVTKEAEALAGELPFAQDTGKGMSRGRNIHKLLEASVKQEKLDLDLMAENLLKEEERLLSEKESIIAVVKAVMSSELWLRMRKAEQVLVEVPFALKVEGEKLPKVVSGAIDLAFREPDGWVIADYKTDKVDGKLDALVAYYRPQVEMYRDFWKEMSGEDIKEAGLYFVDIGKWVRI